VGQSRPRNPAATELRGRTQSPEEFHLLEASTAAERTDELGPFLDDWFGKRWPDFCEPEGRLTRLPLPSPLRQFYAMAGRRPSAGPEIQELFYTGSGGHHGRDLDSVDHTEERNASARRFERSDTEAPSGVVAAPLSLLNERHPRPTNAYLCGISPHSPSILGQPLDDPPSIRYPSPNFLS
jgi:hypothetical protein